MWGNSDYVDSNTKSSMALPSSSVEKHKLPRDTKKQQDNVIFLISEHLKNMTSRFQYILIQKTIPSTISDLQEEKFQEKITQYIDRPVNHCLLKCVTLNKRV